MENTLLTQKEFDELLDYSTSTPTVHPSIVGMKWKRHVYVFTNNKGAKFSAGYVPSDANLVIEDYWLMGEYIHSEKKGYVEIKWTKIVIVGDLPIDKIIYQFNERRKSCSINVKFVEQRCVNTEVFIA